MPVRNTRVVGRHAVFFFFFVGFCPFAVSCQAQRAYTVITE